MGDENTGMPPIQPAESGSGSAVEAGTIGTTADDYDAAHHARWTSSLLRSLWAEAVGDQYPAEVDPFSSCSWWLLGQLVAALRLPARARLVDLGCGTGGVGLWLARALSADLIGIDFSAVAVKLAARRAAKFVKPDRATFRQATFEETGLPDESADGLVSVDAFPLAETPLAALNEVWRILVPGARFALTTLVHLDGSGDWSAMARSAGFEVEQMLVDETADQIWRRLHASWLAHEAELREDIGDHAATNLIVEAKQARQRSAARPRYAILILRRPVARRYV